jgi:hypothetical protein
MLFFSSLSIYDDIDEFADLLRPSEAVGLAATGSTESAFAAEEAWWNRPDRRAKRLLDATGDSQRGVGQEWLIQNSARRHSIKLFLCGP